MVRARIRIGWLALPLIAAGGVAGWLAATFL